jgi:hypothetical protein
VPATDRQVFHLALAELVRRQSEPAIAQPEDLTAFELGVYSQNGEDGVLAEIFRPTPSSSATTTPTVSMTSVPCRGARRTTTVTVTGSRSIRAAGVMLS